MARFYQPLVDDGALFDGFSAGEIEKVTGWLAAARDLTDVHRARIAAESLPGSRRRT